MKQEKTLTSLGKKGSKKSKSDCVKQQWRRDSGMSWQLVKWGDRVTIKITSKALDPTCIRLQLIICLPVSGHCCFYAFVSSGLSELHASHISNRFSWTDCPPVEDMRKVRMGGTNMILYHETLTENTGYYPCNRKTLGCSIFSSNPASRNLAGILSSKGSLVFGRERGLEYAELSPPPQGHCVCYSILIYVAFCLCMWGYFARTIRRKPI